MHRIVLGATFEFLDVIGGSKNYIYIGCVVAALWLRVAASPFPGPPTDMYLVTTFYTIEL